MKKILLLISFWAVAVFAFAQIKTPSSTSYKIAAGIRVWDGLSLNLKSFGRKEKLATELIVFFYQGLITITGLTEFHGDISANGELKWYAGGGSHVTFYERGLGSPLGFDIVLGLDYKFKKFPINLAVDWQPSFELYKSNSEFKRKWPGFAVRYTF